MKEASILYNCKSYWNVRCDFDIGKETPHIHIWKGDREIQYYKNYLKIKHQNGRFTREEKKETLKIAAKYCYGEEACTIVDIIIDDIYNNEYIYDSSDLSVRDEIMCTNNECINQEEKLILYKSSI